MALLAVHTMPLQKERVNRGKRPSLGQRMAQKAAPQTSEGAPADFPGVVMPNPRGIRPMADTDEPGHPDAVKSDQLLNGASFSTKNFTGKMPRSARTDTQAMPNIWKREQ